MTGRPLPTPTKQSMPTYRYNDLKEFVSGLVEKISPKFFRLVLKHKTGVKYFFSGGSAALVNLSFLYIFTDIMGVWYVASAVMAFIISHVYGFFMQKFWTFRETGWGRIHKQTAIYVIMGTAEFIMTPILIYTFVEKFHIWYLLAATMVMGGLAIVNYSVNKFITFKKDVGHEGINA